MYGSVDRAVDEEEPIKPSSPYAASKVAFDMHLVSIFKFKNFPMNIIRPSNAYCPGQLLHRIIPKTIVSGLNGDKVPLHGGGKAEKSYIHARDLGRAIYLVSENAPMGEIYNAGSLKPTSIREVVERCANALDIPFEDLCEIADERLGQDSRYWLNSEKINKHVGWMPTTSWDEGLKEMVDWGKLYYDQIKDLDRNYTLRA